jgi:hypothetical protein
VVINTLVLSSGLRIEEPTDRLLRFCREEFDYYDGLPIGHVDRIEPLDVLATVAVNSRVDNAAAIRAVHRGMAEACDPLLPQIPVDADLLEFDSDLEVARRLLEAAVQVPRVLIPVATKILHRKRPAFIPMLDGVVLVHYFKAKSPPYPWSRTQDKRWAASVGVEMLDQFRVDLDAAQPGLDELRRELASAGYVLSRVRLLELLVWTEVEPRGYYRMLARAGHPGPQSTLSGA